MNNRLQCSLFVLKGKSGLRLTNAESRLLENPQTKRLWSDSQQCSRRHIAFGAAGC